MINNLQLLVFLPYFDLNFPGNANYFLSQLQDLANFNIIPDIDQIQNLLTFNQQFDYQILDDNQSCQDYGFQNCYFTSSLQSLIIITSGGIIALIVYQPIHTKLVRHFNRKSQILNKKYTAQLIFNMADESFFQGLKFSLFIRAFTENYFQISLLCAIVINSYLSFDNWKRQFNSIVGILLAIYCLLRPLGLFIFLIINKKDLDSPEFEQKYGSYYEGIKEGKTVAKFIIVPYTLRRLLFVASLLYFDAILQLYLQLLLSIIMLIMFCYFKPMKEGYQNFLEIYNEFTFLICISLCFLFTDYLPSPEMRYKVGNFMMFIISLNMIVSLLIFVVLFVSNSISQIRFQFRKIRYNRRLTALKMRAKRQSRFYKKIANMSSENVTLIQNDKETKMPLYYVKLNQQDALSAKIRQTLSSKQQLSKVYETPRFNIDDSTLDAHDPISVDQQPRLKLIKQWGSFKDTYQTIKIRPSPKGMSDDQVSSNQFASGHFIEDDLLPSKQKKDSKGQINFYDRQRKSSISSVMSNVTYGPTVNKKNILKLDSDQYHDLKNPSFNNLLNSPSKFTKADSKIENSSDISFTQLHEHTRTINQSLFSIQNELARQRQRNLHEKTYKVKPVLDRSQAYSGSELCSSIDIAFDLGEEEAATSKNAHFKQRFLEQSDNKQINVGQMQMLEQKNQEKNTQKLNQERRVKYSQVGLRKPVNSIKLDIKSASDFASSVRNFNRIQD